MEKQKKVFSPDDPLLNIRVDKLEREYEAEHEDRENQERLEELRVVIFGLLGKSYFYLLREYNDRLIAHYNTDTSWFYLHGVEDGQDGLKDK